MVFSPSSSLFAAGEIDLKSKEVPELAVEGAGETDPDVLFVGVQGVAFALKGFCGVVE